MISRFDEWNSLNDVYKRESLFNNVSIGNSSESSLGDLPY
jgi:hypothetical protein